MSTLISPTSFTDSLIASFDRQDMHRRLLAKHYGVPISAVHKTGSFLDKRGIDYIVRLPNGRRMTVDWKDRRAGIARYWSRPDTPDIAIELYSIVESQVPGPYLVESPYPHVFVYSFGDLPGQLFELPAVTLRHVVRKHMDTWARRYGLRSSVTVAKGGTSIYHSSYILVPISEIWACMADAIHQAAQQVLGDS